MPLKQEINVSSNWFELKIQGKPVGYFTEVSGLSAEVETMTYAEGGRNDYTHVLPTRMKYPNLVLKRGMTSTTALEDWFKQTKTDPSRIVVTLTMYDEAKNTLRTWSFANAFPVKWAGPSFNAGQAQAATETIEIVHEGIQVL
ncbi:MAG: hypothetical protein QOE28_1980 [Solirubrobacteraceae bacterium]|jgi:phage tail-like protein|nr:hypothetical protein [Solirubrobacteraceae bacterium]